VIQEFNLLKKRLLENEFKNLNNPQREAVFTSKGSMLILAGAGSGKTTTVVNKIAYMLKYGSGYDDFDFLPNGFDINALEYMKAYDAANLPPDEYIEGFIRKNPVRPYNILAFTFTNKAANEMKERIARVTGNPVDEMWIGTFHSICVKILRRNIDSVPGYGKNFVIYDTDDQKTLMKSCLSALNISEKEYPPREVLSYIGRAKDKLLTPDEFILENEFDVKMRNIGRIYKYYQQKLLEYNAVDFDDIINLTVKLLTENKDIRDFYVNKFKYVLVDEYQDTNKAQYMLISSLAGNNNLCVVGDDDQSIYGWRGADIQNIIDFESQYTGCKVIKLEQNYRSTQVILDAANEIINNNLMRKGKSLWTAQEGGDKITVYCGDNERDEALSCVALIIDMVKNQGKNLSDFAFLYRTHTQSRIIEDALVREAIAYRIVGGLRFYERKEIKDILAYIKLISNPADNISLKRIINFPKRGIGGTTIERIEAKSHETGISMFEIIKQGLCDDVARSAAKISGFISLMDDLTAYSESASASDIIKYVIAQTLITYEYLKEGEIEGKTRIENMEELISVAVELEKSEEIVDLNDFLGYTSLITDTDVSDENTDCVVLMTMHAAKGLEFPVVFVTGLEEGLFPKVDPYAVDDNEMEEERRLCYVAITRAKEKLFLSYAMQRTLYGQTRYNKPSRFLSELPSELLDGMEKSKPKSVHIQEAASKPKYDFIAAASRIKQKAPAFTQNNNSDFNIGDKVTHNKFGTGTVAGVSASDTLTVLTIDFEGFGRKNIVASAVKLLNK